MASFHLKVVFPKVQNDPKGKGSYLTEPPFVFSNDIWRSRPIGRLIFRNGAIVHGTNIYPNEIDLSNGREYNIVASKIIKSYDGITTLRATLNNSIDVVLKFAMGKAQARLLSQAQYYRNELKGLQGSHIPILYGVFAGEVGVPVEVTLGEKTDVTLHAAADDTVVMTPFHCLVLEDCGESLNISHTLIHNMSRAERQRVGLTLGQFHLLGKVPDDPDDFCEEHTLRKDRQFRTIGFHNLVAHKCAFRKWNFLLKYQSDLEFGCNELRVFGCDIGVWEIYESVDVLGVTFPHSHLLPQQFIIDALIQTFVKIRPRTVDGAQVVLGWIMDIEEWRREELQAERVRDVEDVLRYAEGIRPLLVLDLYGVGLEMDLGT